MSSPKSSETSCDSRARIQLTLPRSVLISPLWATIRYGCASSQLGNVFVEKRECTRASALVRRSSARSGEEAAELRSRQHPLVDERPRREARDHELGAGGELGDPADHVEPALECRPVTGELGRRGDEELADPWCKQPCVRARRTGRRRARRASRAPSAPRRARHPRARARAPAAAPASAGAGRRRRRRRRRAAAKARADAPEEARPASGRGSRRRRRSRRRPRQRRGARGSRARRARGSIASWVWRPSSRATKATPQESCSYAGS